MFKPHFEQVPGPFERACNLEVRTPVSTESASLLVVIDLLTPLVASLSLSPLQSQLRAGPAHVCFFHVAHEAYMHICYQFSGVFVGEIERDCLDVRRWRESFLSSLFMLSI